MHREFIVPEDEKILEAIGTWPETEESGARLLKWEGSEGDSLTLSYDVLSRSVRARWTGRDGNELLDMYREGASRLTVSSSPSAALISIEFNTGECAGALEIQVTPSLSVRDRLLYT
ncbi:hypothetical protein ACH5A3_11875 [Streptomyces echinatus]|uniref:hypothetical protein n=1 Tax=Streptomyces echinatus TaxID=67293 RepID=UPI0037AFE008